MATLIGTEKKAQLKPKCAYFSIFHLLDYPDAGLHGMDKPVCRNKRLENPEKCTRCEHFSTTLTNGDILPDMLDDPKERAGACKIEKGILEQEMTKQLQDDAGSAWHKVRWGNLEVLTKDLKRQEIVIGSRKARVHSRTSENWIEDGVRELVKSKGEDAERKVFKKRIEIKCEDPETIEKLTKAIQNLKKKGAADISASLEEFMDHGAIDELVAAEVIKRDELKKDVHYESKTSKWVQTHKVVKHDDEPKMIII